MFCKSLLAGLLMLGAGTAAYSNQSHHRIRPDSAGAADKPMVVMAGWYVWYRTHGQYVPIGPYANYSDAVQARDDLLRQGHDAYIRAAQ
jgi:hypothetical protein